MRKVLQASIILSAVDKASKVVNGMATNATRRLDTLQRASSRVAAKSGQFARQAAVPAAVMGAALVYPIKKAIDFEQAIANVGAVSRASSDELKAMAAQARKMGAATQYTAVESADAMGFLAMAGFNAKQAIDALPGTLNLAAAGNTDLARTADIASNILTGFGLEARDMGRAGDVLTNTFTSSNVTLEMLGQTMKYAAPIATALGVDLSTVAGMAGKLGDAGIQADMAGTALRSSLLRLSSPLAKGRKSLNEIGVSTLDAAGNLRPMPTILAEIGTAVKNLPTGKQAEVLKNIFGTEAASAGAVLTTQARTGALQTYISTLGKSGSAEATAAARMNTTQGTLLKLKSATDDLAISVGSLLLPGVTELATKAALIANRMAAWSEANPALSAGIAKFAIGLTAVLGVASAVGFVISGISTTVGVLAPILSAVITGVGAAVAAVGAVPIAIGAAIVGAALLIYKYWDNIKSFFVGAWDFMKAAGAKIPEMLAAGIRASIMLPFNAGKAVVQKVRDLLPFSPAKVGPLKDLHKIKLVETIAATIKPAPMVDAMAGAVGTFANSSPTPSAGAGGRGGTVNYSPVLNFTGAVTEQTKADFAAQLRAHKNDIERILRDIATNQLRTSY